jgi:hypothetical protein
MSSVFPFVQSGSQQSQEQRGLGQGLMSASRSMGNIAASQESAAERYKQFSPGKAKYTPSIDTQQFKYQGMSASGSLPYRPLAGGASTIQDLPSIYSFQFSAPNPTSTPKTDDSQIQGQGCSGDLMSLLGSGGANTTQNTGSEFERFMFSGTNPSQDLGTSNEHSKTTKPKYTF